MKHFISTICIAAFAFYPSAQAAPPEARLPEKHHAFFKAHCLDCHDSETQEGKVNLETLPFRIATIEQAELWQKVLDALNSGEMPPKDSQQPGNKEKADFLDDLANTMVAARKVLSDSGGKITMRRLNKRDYQNSIESLLGVRLDTKLLPDDGSSDDFDTVGASLFLSSDKFQEYLKLGRHAIDEFYERRAARTAKPFVYRVEPEETLNVALRQRVERSDEYLKRFEALDAELDQTLALPENKGFEAQMGTRGNRLQLYRKIDLNLKKLKGAPDPTDFGFKNYFSAAKFFPKAAPYDKHYAGLPHSETGTWLQLTMGSAKIVTAPPNEMPAGRYTVRIKAGVTKESPAFRRFLELGHPAIKGLARGQFEGFPLQALQVTGSPANPELIETKVTIGKDTQPQFAIRERQPAWGPLRKHYFYPAMNRNGYGHEPSIWVDWVEIEGPLPQGDPSPLDEIFAANASDRASSDLKRARNILHQFAVKAFREREPSPKFIDSLVDVFEHKVADFARSPSKIRTSGEVYYSLSPKEFDLAIRTPLSMILASPRFLFMWEPGQDAAPRALTDLELAVRLSYFLWSSPPDAQLIELAKKKQLRDPVVLRGQVDRLIRDSRAHHFVSGLAHQWLDMKRLDFFQFDAKEHREFDESMRAAAREEVYQSILHLLRANGNPKRERGTSATEIPRSRVGLPGQRSSGLGSLRNLLKSDYVVINGLLAAHYDLDGVVGDHYRKVSLPEKSPRGGFLGMAAICAMGSDGTESSPVERGAWVLRHLMHSPLPPAPANVPQLSRLDGERLTKREKLAAHMEEAQCASCHRKIDPIGFGLENFDAAGKWREKEAQGKRTHRINPSGAFHKGPAFADFFELRDLIATWQTEEFARSFTEALIEYGLGRPFGFTDEDLANEILVASKNKQYNVSEFIHALVQSRAFQSK